MSDTPDKKGPGNQRPGAKSSETTGSAFPGGGNDDDLLAEFDAWDKNLSSIFEDESTAESRVGDSARATPMSASVAPGPRGDEPGGDGFGGGDFDGSLDFLDDTGSLDDLFNDTPPPLLPPIEEEQTNPGADVLAEARADSVISSASRPELPEEDIAEQEFAMPEDFAEQDFSMLEEDIAEQDFSVPEDDMSSLDDIFGDEEEATPAAGQVTRILDPADPMLAATLRASMPDVLASALPKLPKKPRQPRRTASVVRRDELERMRARRDRDEEPLQEEDDDDDDFAFGGEATRIADVQQLESLMESAAQVVVPSFVDEPEEPEISLELDDEFYDDIEIGEVASEPAKLEVSRRVSRHVVRRDVQSSDSGSDSAAAGTPDEATVQSVTDPVTGAVRSAAREVDPELTLDLRVSDLTLDDDDGDDDGEAFGEELDDQFDEPTNARSDRPSRVQSLSAASPASSSFDDDDVETRVRQQDTEASDPGQEATRVSWPQPSDTRGGHAFLDLEPSPRDTAGHPPQRPTRLPTDEVNLAFLDGINDFGEMVTQEPAVEVIAAVAKSAPKPKMTASAVLESATSPSAVPQFAPSGSAAPGSMVPEPEPTVDMKPVRAEPAATTPATTPITTTDLAQAAVERKVASTSPSGVTSGVAASAERTSQPLAVAADLDVGLEAPNNTYDFGLPAVVPVTRSSAPVVATPSGRQSTDLGSLPTPRASEPAITTPPLSTPDVELSSLRDATRPMEPVHVEAAQPARPSVFASLADQGAEDDWPALPPATLPSEFVGLDGAALAAIDVPERAPQESVERDAETLALAQELELYERELASDEFGPHAKQFRLEAGRLCERLADLERARVHYEEALAYDPLLGPALQALRRIERATGDWNAAMNYLDAELEDAGAIERQALTAHKADVLMAVGEQDLARVVVGERLDHDPNDLRALLANLELAFVDGRDDEFDQTLDQLATLLAAPDLVSCMHMLRGRLCERPVGQPSGGDLAAAMGAYAKAAEAGSDRALVSMALAAQQLGDLETATAAIERLAGSDLEARDPEYVAALEWRRAYWARLASDREGERAALEHASELAGTEPLVLSDRADLEIALGHVEAAAEVLARLAQYAASPAERASAEVRLAECLSALDRGAEAADALRRAAALDPSNPVAAGALERVLERTGDIEALIELDRHAAESDPAGAVFERVRAAGRLLQTGQYERAIADLQAGREVVPESPALSDALLDALERAGASEARLALLQTLTDDSGEMRDAEALLLQLARAADGYAMSLNAEHERMRARLEAGPDATSAAGDATKDATDVAGDVTDETLLDLADKRDRAVTQALDAWNRVLERDPESTDAYAAITRLSAILGEPDLLDDALARAQSAAHDPDYAVTLALARAALVLAEKTPDIPRAEDIAREAMELAPSDPRPPLLLLDLAVSQGRLLDAAMLLEERAATTSDPEQAASLRYRSAVLLLGQADEPAQAIELLRLVVETRPDFDAAKELLEVAHKRLGESVAVEPAAPATRGPLSYERAIRQAEVQLYQLGDATRAIELYTEALRARPGDALARHGLSAAAVAAGDPAPLTEAVLTDLARAEAMGDVVAKADAYEEMARIDSDMRGDLGSARMALRSAIELDDTRVPVLRVLERAYVAEQQWAELYGVRETQLRGLSAARDRMAWHLDRARLASRVGRPVAELMNEYRAAYQLDRRCRPALFHLETEARVHGPSQELAELEADIAHYFAADERAQAAFLTRSAETLAEIGSPDPAIERFREASSLAGGFKPALAGWRHAALVSERWHQAAEAALEEAELSELDDERVALYQLAGVIAMDRAAGPDAGSPDAGADAESAHEPTSDAHAAAITAFEHVLMLDPANHDAFVRLYHLYAGSTRHQELAHLLERRLEVESEPEERARMHRALADLMRTTLGDPDGARHHLRAILELVPNEPNAIEALSEIAWAEEAWDDAAEALIVRARTESVPEVQKGIFFRLGVIYAEHKPEPEWAIKSFKRVLSLDPRDKPSLEYLARLGTETEDWKLALLASERLLELDDDVDAKVSHLHRMGAIYSQGLEDPVRAERAYRSALDLAPESALALSALVEFFEERGDLSSMRVHLDRVLGAMRAQLAQAPANGGVYRVLARAFTARERAGVPGSRATARCAAELALLADPDERANAELADEVVSARPGIAGLDKPDIDDVLFPPVVSNAVRQIFSLVGDRVAKHVGIDLRRYGVGRADRLKDRDQLIVRVSEKMASELELEPPAVYISSKESRLLVVEPTSPISIVVSADLLESADTEQLAFAVGRSIKLAQSSFAVPARMSEDEFGVLMVALLRLFDPEFTVLGVDNNQVVQQQQRLRRLIPSSLVQELRPFAINVAAPDFDYRALWRGIQEAGDRAGLLACGSAKAAVTLLAAVRGLSDPVAGLSDPYISALVRFAVSEDHVTLRGQLGE